MDLPGVLNVVGPMILGATFGAAGWAYALRWLRQRATTRAEALAAAGADVFKDAPLVTSPLALRLVFRGWTAREVHRLEPLATDLNPVREMEVIDALYSVAHKQWPGRTPREQVDWMLALVGTPLGPDYTAAAATAAAYVTQFGHDLAPLACAAGIEAADGGALTNGTLDRQSLIMMAALRGRSGFTA